MRSWTLTFLILTIISGLIGFTSFVTKIVLFSTNIFYISAIIVALTLLYYLLKRKSSALRLALIFLAITAVSGTFAFTNLTAAMIDIAKIAFYVFLILFIIAMLRNKLGKRT